MHIDSFLKKNLDIKKPLLLALSGGPDSLCLYHLLKNYSEKIELHLAHVDHGWREESKEEARLLAKLGEPFHLKVLDPKEARGSLEAHCRKERLAFFAKLQEQFGFQAVALGHHADDLAETILKRFFEAGPLAVMQESSCFGSLVLWRPLLAFRKKEILQWLEERGLSWFHDASNEDERFLRARMRRRIIPELSQLFGKDITTGVLKWGREAEAWEAYLERRTERYFRDGAHCLILSDVIEPLEVRFCLKKLAKIWDCSLNFQQVEVMSRWLLEGASHKVLHIQGLEWHIHQKSIELKSNTRICYI